MSLEIQRLSDVTPYKNEPYDILTTHFKKVKGINELGKEILEVARDVTDLAKIHEFTLVEDGYDQEDKNSLSYCLKLLAHDLGIKITKSIKEDTITISAEEFSTLKVMMDAKEPSQFSVRNITQTPKIDEGFVYVNEEGEVVKASETSQFEDSPSVIKEYTVPLEWFLMGSLVQKNLIQKTKKATFEQISQIGMVQRYLNQAFFACLPN